MNRILLYKKIYLRRSLSLAACFTVLFIAYSAASVYLETAAACGAAAAFCLCPNALRRRAHFSFDSFSCSRRIFPCGQNPAEQIFLSLWLFEIPDFSSQCLRNLFGASRSGSACGRPVYSGFPLDFSVFPGAISIRRRGLHRSASPASAGSCFVLYCFFALSLCSLRIKDKLPFPRFCRRAGSRLQTVWKRPLLLQLDIRIVPPFNKMIRKRRLKWIFSP